MIDTKNLTEGTETMGILHHRNWNLKISHSQIRWNKIDLSLELLVSDSDLFPKNPYVSVVNQILRKHPGSVAFVQKGIVDQL